MKGKKAFLRVYGPVTAVSDTVDGLPAGVPVNRIWTEIHSVDADALAAGIWKIDATRYLVTLRPWVPDWVISRPGWNASHGPCVAIGPGAVNWAYAGIAADTLAAIAAEGPLRINGHGDLPGVQS